MTNAECLLGKTVAQLQTIVTELGMPRFTARQISQWLHQKGATSFDEMTNISKRHRQLLTDNYTCGRSTYIDRQESADGTVKYLFPTIDGKAVETVYIPEGDRATLCVSSQVGCKMNCMFCHTGKQGFQGNLSVADILNQIYSVEHADRLTNIVFMGQGEPLDNYDALMAAIGIITGEEGWAWSPRRITVSTVGLRRNLDRFLRDSECHLAVSLHFPIHELREQYMPAERQMPIADVIDTLRRYDWSHQRRLSMEYTMFDGINDSTLMAKEVVKLLRGLDCRVNLIRYHSVPGVPLADTPLERMTAFRDYLTRHGIFTTIRTSRGQDIDAACGLLNSKSKSLADC
ncbi:MAG: 23S rRNA (adenine(2503)-C(2))-methyltransferase RlmN [Bacteroidaceae bacterium]|nr:23S rRNA (adenine(2503)-C(2))-methyltransferase RlmN [Bacteroidaceae bacterium]MBQ9176926.1 23S rRNA (adenine(2503)-C(2))-methyltransferase RlmN [Bacteroidaceae bacterium]